MTAQTSTVADSTLSSGSRRTQWRRWAIIAVLFLGMMILIVLQGATEEEPIPYDLDSSSAGGLRALRLWLREMGYQVERTGTRRFELPLETDLLFIFPGTTNYDDVEAAIVYSWVEAGGTLVLVGPRLSEEALIDRFGVYMTSSAAPSTMIEQSQPLVPEATANWTTFGVRNSLNLEDAPEVVPVLASMNSDDVFMAVREVGEGVVWYVSTNHDFTNGALRSESQAVLMPPLLRRVPQGGMILFDTYHLYGPSESAEDRINSVREWFYRTPIGRSLLLALAACLLYLILQGRRLGPPLPVVTGERRREAAEYVTAMATLQQRAKLRDSVAHHHKRRLKRALGQPLGISANLSDKEFVRRLEETNRLNPSDLNTVRQLLARLDQTQNEGGLVHLVAQVDALIERRL